MQKAIGFVVILNCKNSFGHIRISNNLNEIVIQSAPLVTELVDVKASARSPASMHSKDATEIRKIMIFKSKTKLINGDRIIKVLRVTINQYTNQCLRYQNF